MERPFAVLGLDHVVLRCRDLPRACAFYIDILGLPEERRLEAIGLIQLRAGRSLVDLVPETATGSRMPNVDHVCLAVAGGDMEAVRAWLAAHGVETIGEPAIRYGARGYAPTIYLRDPEGNVVELAFTGPEGE